MEILTAIGKAILGIIIVILVTLGTMAVAPTVCVLCGKHVSRFRAILYELNIAYTPMDRYICRGCDGKKSDDE